MFQLLVTTRFLRRFGIGTALFVLPATVFLGSAGLLGFWHAGAVVALKGLRPGTALFPGQVHRRIALSSAGARIKIQVKWFIDTVVWRWVTGCRDWRF